MPRIAISYRRSDSAAIAGRIADQLISRYGDNSVFIDIDDIPIGVDYRTNIKDALSTSDILLVLIGPNWLGRKTDGGARIDQEADPIRVEVETALKDRVPVIPVLVANATMPAAEDLPQSLKDLAYLNAAEVDTGRDFRHHMDCLSRSIDETTGHKKALRGAVRRGSGESGHQSALQPWLIGLAALVLIVAGAALFRPAWLAGPSPAPGPSAPPTRANTAVGQPTDATATDAAHAPTYRVLANVSGGVQNLRSGPAVKYAIVVAIPAGAAGITLAGCRGAEDGTRPWCQASWQGHSGWISSCCIVDEATGAPPKLD
jgi:hypothetical protein